MNVDVSNADDVLKFLSADDDVDIAIARPSDSSSRQPTNVELPSTQFLAHLEHSTRQDLMIAEADERVALALKSREPASSRDRRTFESNRRLVANAVIEELYEANCAQREQLRQLIEAVQMLQQRGSRARK